MNRRTFPLGEVSRHRAFLYGFAAMWILLFHMTFSLPEHPAFAPLQWFKNFGNAGVDMFLLLSGFGLYGSLSRNGSVAGFYRRRMTRVFLPTFIVAAIHYGLKFTGEGQYVLKLMAFPYWLGVGVFWYPPFILTMYLTYPLIFRLQQRRPRLMWGLLAFSYALPFLYAISVHGQINGVERAITRIPAFLTGCMLAPMVHRQKRVSLWWMAGALILHIALLQFPWPLSRYSLMPLAALAIMALTLIAPWLTRGGLRRFIYRFTALLGGISLEIYLIQTRLAEWLAKLPCYAPGKDGPIKLDLFCAILTVLLAFMLQSLCNSLVRRFEKTPVPDPIQGENHDSA